MRSREKVEHEDQKQDDEEEDDKHANETVKERFKEVTGNAHTQATQPEKRGRAEESVTKRDRVLNAHTSEEVEPPKKVPKCSLLSPETRPGRPQTTKKNTATGLGVPLATRQEESTSTLTPQKLEKRWAKRNRMLSQHPSAVDRLAKMLKALSPSRSTCEQGRRFTNW